MVSKMNGLRAWVLQDLSHVLPPRSVQAPPANHIHTTSTKRKFWNIFDFGRKQNTSKKCPPPKNTSRSSVDCENFGAISCVRKNVLKAKSVTRISLQKQRPKAKLLASPKLTVNVASYTKRNDFTSLLDGNPVPMNMKLKLKGYKTLRTQKCDEFAFVPGGMSCELDILPARAFDGRQIQAILDSKPASRSVPRLAMTVMPSFEKPSDEAAHPMITLDKPETAPVASVVDVPSHPPTFDSILSVPLDSKPSVSQRDSVSPKTESIDELSSVRPESVPNLNAKCDANSQPPSDSAAKAEEHLSHQAETRPETESTTLDNKHPSMASETQSMSEAKARPSVASIQRAPTEKSEASQCECAVYPPIENFAEDSEGAPVRSGQSKDFLKTMFTSRVRQKTEASTEQSTAPFESTEESCSRKRSSLERLETSDERPKKFEASSRQETDQECMTLNENYADGSELDSPASQKIVRNCGSGEACVACVQPAGDMKDLPENSIPYFAPVPKRKTSFAITHSQLIIHQDPSPGRHSFEPTTQLRLGPAKSGSVSTSFAPNRRVGQMSNRSKTASIGSIGFSNDRIGNFHSITLPNGANFGDGGCRADNVFYSVAKKQASRKQNSEQTKRAARTKSTDSTRIRFRSKDGRVPCVSSCPEPLPQSQSFCSGRRQKCKRDNDSERKCKRKERRKCDEEQDEGEMIPGRTVCTKVREENRCSRNSCKRERSCDRASQPRKQKKDKTKSCKRYCCPALKRHKDCNFEKGECDKKGDKCDREERSERSCGKREKKEKVCGHHGVPRVPNKKLKPDKTCLADEDAKERRGRQSCNDRGREESCGRRRRQDCKREERDESCGKRRRKKSGNRGCNRRMSSLASSRGLSESKYSVSFEMPRSGILTRNYSQTRCGEQVQSAMIVSDQKESLLGKIANVRMANRVLCQRCSQVGMRDRSEPVYNPSVSFMDLQQSNGQCNRGCENFPPNAVLNETYSALKPTNKNLQSLSVATLIRPCPNLMMNRNVQVSGGMFSRNYSQLRSRNKESRIVKSGSDAQSKMSRVEGTPSSFVSVDGRRAYGNKKAEDDKSKSIMKAREKPGPACKDKSEKSDRCGKKGKKAAPGPKCDKIMEKCGKKGGNDGKSANKSKSDEFCAGKKNNKDGENTETTEQRKKREQDEIKECTKHMRKSRGCAPEKKSAKDSKCKFNCPSVENSVGNQLNECAKLSNLMSIGILPIGRQEIKCANSVGVDRAFSTTGLDTDGIERCPASGKSRELDTEEVPILVEVDAPEVTEDTPESKNNQNWLLAWMK